jgi:hypothetical protein
MARNDTRVTRSKELDRAPRRAGADAWQALASAAVASALVAAVAVSALALLDAVLSGTASDQPAQRSRALTGPQNWRAGLQPVLFLPRCTRLEPALCDFDR